MVKNSESVGDIGSSMGDIPINEALSAILASEPERGDRQVVLFCASGFARLASRCAACRMTAVRAATLLNPGQFELSAARTN
jgi:hypothetical protein